MVTGTRTVFNLFQAGANAYKWFVYFHHFEAISSRQEYQEGGGEWCFLVKLKTHLIIIRSKPHRVSLSTLYNFWLGINHTFHKQLEGDECIERARGMGMGLGLGLGLGIRARQIRLGLAGK